MTRLIYFMFFLFMANWVLQYQFTAWKIAEIKKASDNIEKLLEERIGKLIKPHLKDHESWQKESRRPEKLSKARLKKLHETCKTVRDVCNPAVAFAGDEELPPESLSTEECNALLDTIEVQEQINSLHSPQKE